MGIYTPNSPYPFVIRPQSPNPRIRRPEDATLVRYGDIRYMLDTGVLSGGGSLVDITSSGIYNLSVNGQLVPGTRYRVTDYKSVNWLNGYDNAAANNPPTYIPAFSPYTPVNSNLGAGATGGSVLHIATDSTSNAVYVCGSFNDINGSLPTFFQKLNADGTADSTFNSNYVGTSPSPGFDDLTRAAAVQPDGKVVVGGDFTSLDLVTRNRLVRFNANGIIDTVFSTNLGTGFDDRVYAIVIQSDGKILVGGKFANFNGNARNGLVRLNADGTEDTTFATNIGAAAGVGGEVREILISQTGKIYLIGAFLNWNGNANTLNIARLNSNGTFDNTFASGLAPGQKGLTAIHELSNGDIILSGTSVPDTWNLVTLTSYVFRVSSTGAMVNAGWGNVTGSHAHTFTTLSTGEVVVGGSKTTVCDGYSVIGVYSEAGVLNTVYNPGSSFDSDVLSLAVIGNDQYLMCGGLAPLQYQGNAAPETLIALNLSTVGPYQARAVHVSDPEVLVVTAASGSELDPIGYSETYGDAISYLPYFNALGFVEGIDNGSGLPNGNPLVGFDLQWNASENVAYFTMPQGYPVQFGNYFYIDISFTSSAFYLVFEPVKPGYNAPFEWDKFNSIHCDGAIISSDGYTVKLPGITFDLFQQYVADSLFVEVIVKEHTAYGLIEWRKDFETNTEAPFDWRNYRYRRYAINIAGIDPNYPNSVRYLGITDNTPVLTIGDYFDFSPLYVFDAYYKDGVNVWNPLDSSYYPALNNTVLKGSPGVISNYWYFGSFDNIVIMYADSIEITSPNFANCTFEGLNRSQIKSYIVNSGFLAMQDVRVTSPNIGNTYSLNFSYCTIELSMQAIFGYVNSANFLPTPNTMFGSYVTDAVLGDSYSKMVLHSTANTWVTVNHNGTNFVTTAL